MQLSFFIARRYLTRQKGTFSSFIIKLAIVATALSVAVMIIAMGVITGFQHSVRNKLFSFWGHVHIVPHDANPSNIISTNPLRRDPALLKYAGSVKEVIQAAPFILRPAIVQAHGVMEGIRLKGVGKEYNFGKGMDFTGSKLNFADTAYSKDVILSEENANRLNVRPGDYIILYFLEPGTTFPRLRKMKVAGLFHTGMEEIDRYFGICDIRLLQKINNWDATKINGYQIDIYNSYRADSVAANIEQNYILPTMSSNAQTSQEPPLYTETINEIYPNIFDWLNMQDINVRILIVIMSIVSVINLSAALLIIIIDRARMVGLFKAMGMPFKDIRWIFIYLSGLIGGIGVLTGTAFSLGLAWLQHRYGFIHLSESTYYMSTVPVEIVWWHVVLIDAFSIVICMLCMVLPTLYIRRIQPARVLQFS